MSSTETNPATAQLLDDIRFVMERHGFSKTGFGKAAVKDPSLVPDLERGREPRWQTVKRVREFMESLPDQEQAAQ